MSEHSNAHEELIEEISALKERILDLERQSAEEKRAALVLKESGERYRLVVDNVQDGIILQEASGRIRIWNKGAERVFGITTEEALCHTSTSCSWNTIHEDGSEFPGEQHPSMRTLATGIPFRDVKMGVTRASGEISWINIHTCPLFREGETKPYAVIVAFSDIAGRNLAEEALNERIKELDCLQSISEAVESGEGLEHILLASADALSNAFLYTDIAGTNRGIYDRDGRLSMTVSVGIDHRNDARQRTGGS